MNRILLATALTLAALLFGTIAQATSPGTVQPAPTITLTTTPTLRSAARQVALVELFTSEGCSSCPPADRWLSGLKQQAGLWRDFVPVAFHVDYWDSLGWQDRFAAPAFSTRQQRYAQAGNLRQVYTPGLLLRGAEWRGWTHLDAPPDASPPLAGPMQLLAGPQGQIEASWWPAQASNQPVTLNLVLLGFELSSAVRRGENSGKQLQHDFVVLGSSSVTMTNFSDQSDGYRGSLALPTARSSARRYALAAWVSRGSDPTPLQAVGGWWPSAPP